MMLEKFGAKKEKQASQKLAQQKDKRRVDPDPLESSEAGSTIEWHELTAKTRRYIICSRKSRSFCAIYIGQNFVVGRDKVYGRVYWYGRYKSK